VNSVNVNNVKNVSNTHSMYLWHKRLGHLHVNGMSMLMNKQMVIDYPVLSHSTSNNHNINHCLGCINGKQHRTAMPHVATHRSTKPLQLIHSDICGPMQNLSLGGARYFITFIDDYTRYTTVYTMKHKNEALHHFTTFKLLVENQHQPLTIKSFRSDGGGEYISQAFTSYLREHGIQRQQTPPYTPEHNGVAERMNRTLVECARSMLHDAQLSYKYWGEAVITACYIRNRCPTRSLSSINLHITPYEAWFGIGNKPSIQHLRVFGCKCYAHIPDVKRSKLDSKAIECIFVGYSSESKAYRLHDLTNNRILISRDVTFIEENVNIDVVNDKLSQSNNINMPTNTSTSITSGSVNDVIIHHESDQCVVFDHSNDSNGDFDDISSVGISNDVGDVSGNDRLDVSNVPNIVKNNDSNIGLGPKLKTHDFSSQGNQTSQSCVEFAADHDGDVRNSDNLSSNSDTCC
jgi:hypothetical protein